MSFSIADFKSELAKLLASVSPAEYDGRFSADSLADLAAPTYPCYLYHVADEYSEPANRVDRRTFEFQLYLADATSALVHAMQDACEALLNRVIVDAYGRVILVRHSIIHYSLKQKLCVGISYYKLTTNYPV